MTPQLKQRPCVLCSVVAALWIVVCSCCHGNADEAPQLSQSTNVADPAPTDADTPREVLSDWQAFAELDLGDISQLKSGQLIDVLLTSEVFSRTKTELYDLRLIDRSGASVPFRLNVLSPRLETVELDTKQFNRSETATGVQQITLEVTANAGQQVSGHNQVLIETTKGDFQRSVLISGSNDATDWQELARSTVLQLMIDLETVSRTSCRYPESRYRFVRIEVSPDANRPEDKFTIERASLLHQVELPGENVDFEVQLSEREPARVAGRAGSMWTLKLPEPNTPCSQLTFEVRDQAFVRNIEMQFREEQASIVGPTRLRYLDVRNPVWRRQGGTAAIPIVVSFDDVQTDQMQLKIADDRNKPLTLLSVRGSAAARQLLFELPVADRLPLRLFVGNESAGDPNYDFSRNLREVEIQVAHRATLKRVQTNPDYKAPPIPLTERLPWLIYVVLSLVCLVLATVILKLSRQAIQIHDTTGLKVSEQLKTS